MSRVQKLLDRLILWTVSISFDLAVTGLKWIKGRRPS